MISVPKADIVINGISFTERGWWEAVNSVTFKEEKNSMSYVDIVLSANPYKQKGEKWYNAVKAGGESIFSASSLYGKKGGSKVEVSFSYNTYGPPQTLDFEGQCITLKPNYGESESPTFTITAYDYSVFMNQISTKDEASYQNMQVKEIVREIVKRYDKVLDSEPDIDDIPPKTLAKDDQIFKSDVHETDRDWLVAVAKRINFLFYVRGKKLYFKDINKIVETEEELLYRPSLSRASAVTAGNATKGIVLKSFEPKADIGNIQNNMKVHSPNNTEFGNVSGEATEIVKKMGKTSVDEIVFDVFGSTYSYQFVNSVKDIDSAQQTAAELLSSMALNFMSGCGVLQEGNPGLRLGQLRRTEVNGFGAIDTDFSGQYLISMTQHTINQQGYNTEFEIQRNAICEKEEPVMAREGSEII
jgi:phage protein D